MAKNVKLGSVARDRISGLEGVVTARHEYLSGCNKIDITPLGVDKDGKPHASVWFDEQCCDVVKTRNEAGEYVDVLDEPSGGPATMPRRTL